MSSLKLHSHGALVRPAEALKARELSACRRDSEESVVKREKSQAALLHTIGRTTNRKK